VRNWPQNKLYGSNRRSFDLDIIDIAVRGTGRKILKLFDRIDESKEAMETVGGAFWFAVFVATYYGVRHLSS
jgi:hypothetical protein